MCAPFGAVLMFLGTDNSWTRPRKIFADREKPVLLIGQSAQAQIRRLALDDAHGERGFAFFGDLAHILPYIPAKRIQDVILIEPDPDFPPPINPFKSVAEADWPDAASHITEAFKAVFDPSIATVQLDNNALLAAFAMLAVDDGTLFSLPYLFESSAYRSRVIPRLKDPVLRGHWEAFHSLSPREQNERATSILNRLLPLTTDPHIRRMIAQNRAYRITEKSIVLIDFPSSDRYALIAAFLMARLKGTVYIERPMVFVGGSVPIVAADYLDELPRRLRNQLIGTATIVAFKLGNKDAEALKGHFEINPQNNKLTDLAAGSAYVRSGNTHFIDTRPHSYTPNGEVAEKIRSRAKMQAGRRQHTDAKIGKFVGGM